MPLRTTAFDKADQLGWSIGDLAKRSGLSKEALYKVRDGTRTPGPRVIEGLLRAFPNLGYRDLFLPDDRPRVHKPRPAIHAPEPSAAA